MERHIAAFLFSRCKLPVVFLLQSQDESDKRNRLPFGRQPAVRPPAKPFNAAEARQLALLVTRAQGPEGSNAVQLGSHRFVGGYLEKTVAMKVRAQGGGIQKWEGKDFCADTLTLCAWGL